MNNLDWIKENAPLFFDQNINMHSNLIAIFEKKGYKKINSVLSFNYIGANDGKLLSLIKEKGLILITFDKKFYKMAIKYNSGMSILVRKYDLSERPNDNIGNSYLFRIIQNQLLTEFKAIKSFVDSNSQGTKRSPYENTPERATRMTG